MPRSFASTCTAALLASLACGNNGPQPAAPGTCLAGSPDAGPVAFRTCAPPGSPKFVDGHTVGPSTAPSSACVKPVSLAVSNYGVQKFCANPVGTRLSFSVPPGTGSISIVSQAYTAQDSVTIDDAGVPNSVAPTSVVDSSGRSLLDTPYTALEGEDAGIFYAGLSPSTGAMTFPDTSLLLDEVTKNGQLPAGTWSFNVDDLANDCRLFSNCKGGGSGGNYDVTVITKPTPPASGTIDIGIYLVETSGYTSATATADAALPATPMGRMIQTLETLLGRAGLCLGTVTFYGVPSWAQSAYSTTIDADKTDPCSTLNQMFANLSQPGNTMNLFLVASIISTSSRARFCTWGSDAAFRITVDPLVSAAAISAFSVAITDGSSMNTSVGRSPCGALRVISRSQSTTAPIARNASRCGSRRRRPITSPPGEAMTARWKRASRGPASRNDARIRPAHSSSTSTSRVAAAHSATSFGPRQLTSTPIALRMFSIASTSRIRGTLRTITSSSVRTAEARIASAPFLFPAGTMMPESGTPPSMTNFSMSCTRRRRPNLGPLV